MGMDPDNSPTFKDFLNHDFSVCTFDAQSPDAGTVIFAPEAAQGGAQGDYQFLDFTGCRELDAAIDEVLFGEGQVSGNDNEYQEDAPVPDFNQLGVALNNFVFGHNGEPGNAVPLTQNPSVAAMDVDDDDDVEPAYYQGEDMQWQSNDVADSQYITTSDEEVEIIALLQQNIDMVSELEQVLISDGTTITHGNVTEHVEASFSPPVPEAPVTTVYADHFSPAQYEGGFPAAEDKSMGLEVVPEFEPTEAPVDQFSEQGLAEAMREVDAEFLRQFSDLKDFRSQLGDLEATSQTETSDEAFSPSLPPPPSADDSQADIPGIKYHVNDEVAPPPLSALPSPSPHPPLSQVTDDSDNTRTAIFAPSSVNVSGRPFTYIPETSDIQACEQIFTTPDSKPKVVFTEESYDEFTAQVPPSPTRESPSGTPVRASEEHLQRRQILAPRTRRPGKMAKRTVRLREQQFPPADKKREVKEAGTTLGAPPPAQSSKPKPEDVPAIEIGGMMFPGGGNQRTSTPPPTESQQAGTGPSSPTEAERFEEKKKRDLERIRQRYVRSRTQAPQLFRENNRPTPSPGRRAVVEDGGPENTPSPAGSARKGVRVVSLSMIPESIREQSEGREEED